MIEANLRALPLFLDVIVENIKNASGSPGYVMEIGIVQEVKTREERKLKYSLKPKNCYFLINMKFKAFQSTDTNNYIIFNCLQL